MDYLKFGACVNLVKSQSDILKIFSEHTTLRKNGEVYVGKCPFHEDDGESLKVNPSEGIYYCDSCHVGGNVFNFIARVKNISLAEALELQAKSIGLDIYSTKINFEDERVNNRNRALTEVNDFAKDFYHEILTRTDKGEVCRKYLESRGISQREIEKFQLGFAPNEEGKLSAYLDDYGFKFELTLQTGLVAPTNEGFKDSFQDCITIPILNQFGHTTAIIGRVFNFEKKVFYETEGLAGQYIFPRENPVFNSYQLIFGLNEARNFIVASNSVIVVENCLDAIYLAGVGVENVVATFDNTLNERQAEMLGRRARKIIFCLKQGDILSAEEGVLKVIASNGAGLFVAALPKNLYEYVSENGKDNFLQKIEDALPFDNYEFKRRTYTEVENKKNSPDNEKSLSGLIKHKPTAQKLGWAILKVACRDPALFRYVTKVIPVEIFDEKHQETIEYLKICLDENSRPVKEGAEIFFEGNVDPEFLEILENNEPLNDLERMACADAVDHLLEIIRLKDYSKTKLDILAENGESQKKLEILSKMYGRRDY